MSISFEEVWGRKDDQELKKAASELLDYRAEVREIILAELARRNMLDGRDISVQKAPVIPQPDRSDLLAALDLKEEEIVINKQGNLSKGQENKLRRLMKNGFIFSTSFAIVIATVMYGVFFMI